jgi:archaellum component FlaC
MAIVTLIHPQERVEVSSRLLVRKSDLFADDPTLANSPYSLKSQASPSDFREFIAVLEGTAVKVTNNNVKGLSQLCEEFRFRDFAAQLSQFRESGSFTENAAFLPALKKRILALEEQMQDGKREIASLRRELGRVQHSSEERIRTEAESASRRANEVEKHVGEVRSKVETLRNALSEVKILAEGAKQKAESMEAQLGRVARLEGEVSALSTRFSVLAPSRWNSAIVPDFPKLFDEFREQTFSLLWRGSRDGFGKDDFHRRCDRHPNTLTVILDTNGNIFGGFTPVEWEARNWNEKYENENNCWKADPNLKSFLFTLKNPHNVPARKFALRLKGRTGNHL